MRFRAWPAILSFLGAAALPGPPILGQDQPSYSRKNTLAIYAGYANDSSPILLGASANRKIVSFGVDYARRIWLRPSFNLQYLAELTPFTLESDPTSVGVFTTTIGGMTTTAAASSRTVEPCRPTGPFTFSGTTQQGDAFQSVFTTYCKRTYTYGQGLSPLGLRLNLLPGHRLQPLLEAVGGYLLSAQPVPVNDAGSFNFTFGVGAGVEFYRAHVGEPSFFANRSLTAEYRYTHLSNANTANFNPGIDAGVYLLRYSFGR